MDISSWDWWVWLLVILIAYVLLAVSYGVIVAVCMFMVAKIEKLYNWCAQKPSRHGSKLIEQLTGEDRGFFRFLLGLAVPLLTVFILLGYFILTPLAFVDRFFIRKDS